ncbi:hypothetical protein [Flectobacillus roseus]|uniref:hypothetical protein n=1 Tax=Flectobacillus roseus TaxID=502259 RepID=UPI0024B6E3F0|nr:hypothetical protein [Flectobacillus roseus]MDI9867918.1 hypothetical protein [Flectobacillus roseus]
MRFLVWMDSKLSLAVLIVCFMSACRNENTKNTSNEFSENSQKVPFELPQPLGKISISLPERYDTVFHWIDYSDCPSCHHIKYRAQPKHFPILKETGFISVEEPQDSIERFTIKHPLFLENLPIEDSISIVNLHWNLRRNHNLWREICTECSQIKLETITKINNHTFSVFGLKGYNSKQCRWIKLLIAQTSRHGNLLEFRFEIAYKRDNQHTHDFFQNSMSYLKSIRFENH